jgi:hypothetical protein
LLWLWSSCCGEDDLTDSRIILVNCGRDDFDLAASAVAYARGEMPGKEAIIVRGCGTSRERAVFVRKNKASVLVRFEDKGTQSA